LYQKLNNLVQHAGWQHVVLRIASHTLYQLAWLRGSLPVPI